MTSLVRSSESRLVAAHIIGRVARTGGLVDALAIPHSLIQGLTLLARNRVASPQLAPARKYLDQASTEALQQLLGMAPESKMTAVAIASAFLPTMREMQKGLPATGGRSRK